MLRSKKRIIWLGLLISAAAWCVWYARPVDIHFLMGQEQIKYLNINVTPQSGFPDTNFHSFLLSSEDPCAEAVMEQLEALRFHRSPLEPLLRLLPGGSSCKSVDPERDYTLSLYFHGEDWETYLNLEFNIDEWRYGAYARLPLYVPKGQEKGRELGAFLVEVAGEIKSNS